MAGNVTQVTADMEVTIVALRSVHRKKSRFRAVLFRHGGQDCRSAGGFFRRVGGVGVSVLLFLDRFALESRVASPGRCAGEQIEKILAFGLPQPGLQPARLPPPVCSPGAK
jgi:hypothetical protein